MIGISYREVPALVVLLATACFSSEFVPPKPQPYYVSADGRWSIKRTHTDPDPDDRDLGERLRRSSVHVVVDVALPKGQLLDVLLRNREKFVCAVDESGALYDYDLVDLDHHRRTAKWINEDATKYMIPSPIGPYQAHDKTLGGSLAKDGWTAFLNARKQAIEQYRDEQGRRVYVYLGTDFDENAAPRIVHDLFGYHMREGFEIVRKAGSTVIETRRGLHGRYVATWLTKDVVLSVNGLDHYPESVVMAYLEKYPSVLPADLSFDEQAWAIKQLDLSLAILQQGIEEPDNVLSARGPPYLFSQGRHGFTFFACDAWWNRHRITETELYRKCIRAAPQDFEGYRKGLIELRERTVAEAEEMVKKAKAEGVRFVQVKPGERVLQIGRTPEDEAREKQQVLLLKSVGYSGGAGLLLLLLTTVLIRARKSRKDEPPLAARLIVG